MHIFFNDTPLILVKPGKKIVPGNYQVHLSASEKIHPEKLINNVLMTNVSASQVEDVIKFLSDNVFNNVTSITLDVKNYNNAKDFIKMQAASSTNNSAISGEFDLILVQD